MCFPVIILVLASLVAEPTHSFFLQRPASSKSNTQLRSFGEDYATAKSRSEAARLIRSRIVTNDSAGSARSAPRFDSITIPPNSSLPRLRDLDVSINTRIPDIGKKLLPSVDGKYEQLRNGLSLLLSFVLSTSFINIIATTDAYQALPMLTRYIFTLIFAFLPLGVVFLGLFKYNLLSDILIKIEKLVVKSSAERVYGTLTERARPFQHAFTIDWRRVAQRRNCLFEAKRAVIALAANSLQQQQSTRRGTSSSAICSAIRSKGLLLRRRR